MAATLTLEIGQQFVPYPEILTAVIAVNACMRRGIVRNSQAYREAVGAFKLVIEIRTHGSVPPLQTPRAFQATDMVARRPLEMRAYAMGRGLVETLEPTVAVTIFILKE